MAKKTKTVKKPKDVVELVQSAVRQALTAEWQLEDLAQNIWDNDAYDIFFPALKREVKRQLSQ